MVYLQNQNFLEKEKLRIGLQKIYGLGVSLSNQICDQLGFPQDFRIRDLTSTQKEQLLRVMNQYYFTGSELQRLQREDIQRLQRIGCLKGFRHAACLPVRGQRTKTNGRTARKILHTLKAKEKSS